MLQSVGLQRVSRDSATEQQIRQEKKKGSDCSIFAALSLWTVTLGTASVEPSGRRLA